jgi:hypothetical protein
MNADKRKRYSFAERNNQENKEGRKAGKEKTGPSCFPGFLMRSLFRFAAIRKRAMN